MKLALLVFLLFFAGFSAAVSITAVQPSNLQLIEAGLGKGSEYYIDRTYAITSEIPYFLENHKAIKTPADPATTSAVSFNVNAPVRVFLAWDTREAFFTGWESTNAIINVTDAGASNSGQMTLMFKDFPAGTVSIPKKSIKINYFIFVVDKTQLISDSELYKMVSDSLMSRIPNPAPNYGYPNALMLYGLERTWKNTGDQKYFNYIRNWIDPEIYTSPIITGTAVLHVNMDAIILPILFLFEETHESKYLDAAKQIAENYIWAMPKTRDGGVQHVPGELWGDTMFMIGPPMGRLGKDTGEQRYFDEGANQFIIHANRLQDPSSGLLYHGWKDSDSSNYPIKWGRANGWYFMGLIEFLDYLPASHPKRAQLLQILRKQADGLKSFQDPKTGLWFQIIDQPSLQGNWIETSASAMFVYGLKKSIERGYLPSSVFSQTMQNGWKGLGGKAYVNSSNLLVITDICVGTSVGSTADFYLTRPKAENDAHGVGAFILASNRITALPQTAENCSSLANGASCGAGKKCDIQKQCIIVPTSACPDAKKDGTINILDLTRIVKAINENDLAFNIAGDSAVDIADLQAAADKIGTNC
ncbi:MAG: glycoside hydrolase family 88 protein [Candidatus Diapherotrites archaeon]|nr:glycoside hydrolase family 88 protein [Candidatus Diapherotrites archaeon]